MILVVSIISYDATRNYYYYESYIIAAKIAGISILMQTRFCRNCGCFRVQIGHYRCCFFIIGIFVKTLVNVFLQFFFRVEYEGSLEDSPISRSEKSTNTNSFGESISCEALGVVKIEEIVIVDGSQTEMIDDLSLELVAESDCTTILEDHQVEMIDLKLCSI